MSIIELNSKTGRETDPLKELSARTLRGEGFLGNMFHSLCLNSFWDFRFWISMWGDFGFMIVVFSGHGRLMLDN